jgi:nitrate/nitrite-specific signal transduction histidine kinase
MLQLVTHQKQQIQSTEAALTDFVHDIKTPVTAMKLLIVHISNSPFLVETVCLLMIYASKLLVLYFRQDAYKLTKI